MKVNLKKYRQVLVLGPLFAFTGILIIYYFMGSFLKGKDDVMPKDSPSKLNTQLPSPAVEDKDKNKLEIYMQSYQDSVKKQTENKNPSVKRFFNPGPPDDSSYVFEPSRKGKRSTQRNIVQQEKRVNEQLEKIYKELNTSAVENTPERGNASTIPASTEIDRLNKLINSLHSDTTGDSELIRLDAMLNKIIQIQNPKESNHDPEYNTDSLKNANLVGLQPEKVKLEGSSVFHGLDQADVSLTKQKTAIRAVVHETQTIQSGSTVKLRLTENVFIGQMEIPSGSFIYGTCDISDERLEVKIDRIVYNNTLYPIKLSAFDSDGIVGINIPGAITRDATKEGIDRTIQTLSMSGLDGSVAAQATGAGIQSLSSLLRKKVKQIKVTIKAGHQVYLQ